MQLLPARHQLRLNSSKGDAHTLKTFHKQYKYTYLQIDDDGTGKMFAARL